jgi:hypothetical protein
MDQQLQQRLAVFEQEGLASREMVHFVRDILLWLEQTTQQSCTEESAGAFASHCWPLSGYGGMSRSAPPGIPILAKKPRPSKSKLCCNAGPITSGDRQALYSAWPCRRKSMIFYYSTWLPLCCATNPADCSLGRRCPLHPIVRCCSCTGQVSPVFRRGSPDRL